MSTVPKNLVLPCLGKSGHLIPRDSPEVFITFGYSLVVRNKLSLPTFDSQNNQYADVFVRYPGSIAPCPLFHRKTETWGMDL